MHQEVLGWASQSRTSGAVPVVMECDAHRLEAMEAPVPSWSRADNLTGADTMDKIWVPTVHRCLPTVMTIFVRPEGIESLQCSW